MATHWYCKIMGDEQGPLSARQLQSMAHRGQLAIDDLVRKHADGHWVRAENVVGLFDRSTLSTLPVVLKSSVAVIHGFTLTSSSEQITRSMSSAAAQRCSIEFESIQSKSTQIELAGQQSTVAESGGNGPASAGDFGSRVVVPRRTLKVGEGATANARYNRLANQTTRPCAR